MAKRPKAKFKLKDRDLGMKALMRRAREVGNLHLRVGVFEGKDTRPDGEIGNVELALIHEFGAPSVGVPERAPIRTTLDTNADQYRELLKQTAMAYLELDEASPAAVSGPRRVLSILGATIVGHIQRTISAGLPHR
jgi:hypothetical protein